MFSNCGAGEDSRVPWTARWSGQSILEEISPEYPLKGLLLKLQYFGLLMWRTDSFEKTLMLGKIEGRRRRGNDRGWDGWMAWPTRWAWVWASSRSWWWTGKPGVLQSMGSTESQIQLSHWTGNWFTLFFSRNWHNTVKQLYSKNKVKTWSLEACDNKEQQRPVKVKFKKGI